MYLYILESFLAWNVRMFFVFYNKVYWDDRTKTTREMIGIECERLYRYELPQNCAGTHMTQVTYPLSSMVASTSTSLIWTSDSRRFDDFLTFFVVFFTSVCTVCIISTSAIAPAISLALMTDWTFYNYCILWVFLCIWGCLYGYVVLCIFDRFRRSRTVWTLPSRDLNWRSGFRKCFSKRLLHRFQSALYLVSPPPSVKIKSRRARAHEKPSKRERTTICRDLESREIYFFGAAKTGGWIIAVDNVNIANN